MANAVRHSGTRVVVIESIPLILGGLRSALEDGGITVAAGTHDPHAGVRAVREKKPDVVIVDLDLPGRAGIGLLQQLRRQYPAPRLIAAVSTEHDDDSLLLTTLMAGATGYLLKNTETADITPYGPFSGGTSRWDRGPAANSPPSWCAWRKPTARSVPGAYQPGTGRATNPVSLGYGNRRIAQELFISEKTVRNYVSAILPKIHVSSRLEAIVSARLAGLETADPSTGTGTART